MRGMAPYGPASAARTAAAAREGQAGGQATLTGCVRFLGAQVAWMSTEPDFPIDDFADEVAQCLRVLRRWDVTAEDRGQMVPCPTVMEDGSECGKRLGFHVHLDEQVTCRKCGATRDVPQLLMAANADNALVDAEALAGRYQINAQTIRKWARQGRVERQGQRYRLGDVRVMVEQMRGQRVG